MKQKRRQGGAGIQSTPCFKVLLADHSQALPAPPAKTSSLNSSKPSHPPGRGKHPGPLIPFLLYSFISQPLDSSDQINLIQERGTKHRGPSLLHLHAKGDPHHCKLIKELPLRSTFVIQTSTTRLSLNWIPSTLSSSLLHSSQELRRITLNWFEIRIDWWKNVRHALLYLVLPRQPTSQPFHAAQPAVSAFSQSCSPDLFSLRYQLALRLLAPEHHQAPPEAPI